MATVEAGSSEDLKELITSEPLTVTKGSGLAAVVAAIAVPLSTALGAFKDEPTSIVIAAMGLIAVALVVVGFVVVEDMRTRSRQTIESKRLAARMQQETDPPDGGGGGGTRRNGHKDHVRVVRPDGEIVEVS